MLLRFTRSRAPSQKLLAACARPPLYTRESVRRQFALSSRLQWEVRRKTSYGGDNEGRLNPYRPTWIRDSPSDGSPPPAATHQPTYNDGKKPTRGSHRPQRASLGVFSQRSNGRKQDQSKKDDEAEREHRREEMDAEKRTEMRTKIKTSMSAVEDLPPLTDEDFRDIYEDLLQYDPAPPSPSQLQLEQGEDSETSFRLLSDRQLAAQATSTAGARIRELQEKLAELQNERAENAMLQRTWETNSRSSLAALLQQQRLPPATATSSGALLADKEEQTTEEVSQTLGRQPSTENILSEQQHSKAEAADGFASMRVTSATVKSGEASRSRLALGIGGAHEHLGGRRKVLETLEALHSEEKDTPDNECAESESPTLQITAQEWSALALSAAGSRDVPDLVRTLDLMQRAHEPISGDLLCGAIRLVGQSSRDLPVLLQYLEERKIQLSGEVHHEVVKSILRKNEPEHVHRAESYIRTLEELGTAPLQKTYNTVIRSLLLQKRSFDARKRGWNLYNHMRLVAHPKPETEVFDTMIWACSLDDKVAPERALDLFVEMIELKIKPAYTTYNALIRTCARAKDEVFYYEALRLLRELLDRGFQPEKDIFISLLEGARPRGDLARAKWIVGNMVDLTCRGAGRQLAPDHVTIANLFQVYATYKPDTTSALQTIGTGGKEIKAAGRSRSAEVSGKTIEVIESKDREARILKASDAGPETQVAFPEPEHIQPYHELFKSPLPTSSKAIVRQASAILSCILGGHEGGSIHIFDKVSQKLAERDLSGTTPSASQPESHESSSKADAEAERTFTAKIDPAVIEVLREVEVNNYLLNTFLAVLCSHAPIQTALHFFRHTYPSLGVGYSYQTFEQIFSRLDTSVKSAEARIYRAQQARELFRDWKDWLQSRSNGLKPERRHRHTEMVWAKMIGIETRAGNIDAAFELLEDFYQRYPPSDIQHFNEDFEMPDTPASLAPTTSFLYPETNDAEPARRPTANTAPSAASSRSKLSDAIVGTPPHLTFQAVYSLFRTFRENEDARDRRVTEITSNYAKALEEGDDVRRVKLQKFTSTKTKQARKRLVNAEPIPEDEIPRITDAFRIAQARPATSDSV